MITPIQKNRVFEDVAIQIKEQIEQGVWKEGEKILGEMELARLFQVSRGSIREAIKSLQTLGILEAHSGQGTFVSPNALQKLSNNRLTEMVTNEAYYDEILECRYIIESQAAYIAAKVCTEEDINYLMRSYNEMMEYTEKKEIKKYNACGHAFHAYIVDLMHNEILSTFYASIVPLLYEERETFSNTMDMKKILEAHEEHLKLIEALKEHDPDKAKTIIEHHLGWKIKDKNWE